MDSSFGFILLAAGNASRMGRPKQLLDFHGMPMIRHAATEAIASGCSPVIVVCGAVVDPIREALEGLSSVEIAVNDDWKQGMGTSIQCGLRRLNSHSVAGMILGLADQPLVGRAVYRELIAIHAETGRPIVSAQYSATVGVPALFAKECFGDLLALPPSQGCKGVIQANASRVALLDCPDAAHDIDTVEDYERVLASAHARNRS